MYTKNKFHFYTALIVAIISIAGYVTSAVILEIRTSALIDKKNELIKNEYNAEKLKKIEKVYQSTVDGNVLVDDNFAKNEDNIDIIESLEKFVRLHGAIAFIQSAEVEDVATGTLDVMHIVFDATGDWKNIINLLDSFDQFSYVNMIDEITFSSEKLEDSKESRGRWRASFNMKVPLIKNN